MIGVSWLVGLLAGLAGTRLMRLLAPRIGLVDAPDGVRKLQAVAMPLGGGLAIFFGLVAGVLAAVAVDPRAASDFVLEQRAWLACLASAALLVAVGLLDDWYELIARYKLLGQIAAAIVLVYGGDVMIRFVSAFGNSIELGFLAGPISIVFLLFAINSLNLLDGMDGLLGTVGAVTCLALAAVAYISEQYLSAAVALAMAGSLMGFLRYNFPPASIYMGDCGSMLVGLVVGMLCIKASLKSHAVATLIPMCVLVLPLLDTTAAVIRRRLSGRSMAQADREHLHHVLLKRGLSPRRTLLVVAIAGGFAGVGAVASIVFGSELIGLSVSLGVIAVLIGSGLFGGTELRLMGRSLSTTAQAMTRRNRASSQLDLPSRPASAMPPAPSP